MLLGTEIVSGIQKIFCCLSLTEYLISKLCLPFLRVIFVILHCGLVDAKIRASDKNLPVFSPSIKDTVLSIFMIIIVHTFHSNHEKIQRTWGVIPSEG